MTINLELYQIYTDSRRNLTVVDSALHQSSDELQISI